MQPMEMLLKKAPQNQTFSANQEKSNYVISYYVMANLRNSQTM